MAEDLTQKKRALARNLAIAAGNVYNGIKLLQDLATERTKLGGDFDDADLETQQDLKHLSNYYLNALTGDITPALVSTLAASANTLNIEEILVKCKNV